MSWARPADVGVVQQPVDGRGGQGLAKITDRFVAAVQRFAKTEGIPWVLYRLVDDHGVGQ